MLGYWQAFKPKVVLKPEVNNKARYIVAGFVLN